MSKNQNRIKTMFLLVASVVSARALSTICGDYTARIPTVDPKDLTSGPTNSRDITSQGNAGGRNGGAMSGLGNAQISYEITEKGQVIRVQKELIDAEEVSSDK
jgi:hypothetical protein